MLIKQKNVSLLINLAHVIFNESLIVFLVKENLLYLLCLMSLRYCFQHLMKKNCLLKAFLRILILMTRVSLYLLLILYLM